MQLIPSEIFTYITITIIIAIFFILLVLKVIGIFNIFSWVSEFLDLRKRRKNIEELEALDKIRKENLEGLSSLIEFKILNLSHNLKIPAPSVDLQVAIHNNSVFDVKLKKFIFKPSLLGIRGALSESTFDHEIKIPHQSSNWFETKFMIPEGIAKHLENCKRYANGGKHGKLTWHFSCTGYFVGPKGDFRLPQQINYYKERYEIELPRKRAV